MLKSLHHVPGPLLARALGQAARLPLHMGAWEQVAERRFQAPAAFRGCADFELRMMRPTLADHQIADAELAAARTAFARRAQAQGAHFARPMHGRVLRRRAWPWIAHDTAPPTLS